jgi:hypothetical protein
VALLTSALHSSAEARRKLRADVAALQADHDAGIRGTLAKICDCEEDMYAYRVQAQNHLRRTVSRIRRKNLGHEREAGAVERMTRAYEAHVNPDDALAALRRAAVRDRGLH